MRTIARYFPLLIAGYVTATGVFFLLSPFLNASMVSSAGSGKSIRLVISILLTITGVIYTYLFLSNKLQRKGQSIVEIRLEAIKKYDSPSILADIVRNEPVAEIREAAQRRLEEISG